MNQHQPDERQSLVRRATSPHLAKRYAIGGACGFVGSLVLIIGALLVIYPCANLTATSQEPFVCRHLSGAQAFITILTIVARLSFLAAVVGLCLWLYHRSRHKPLQ